MIDNGFKKVQQIKQLRIKMNDPNNSNLSALISQLNYSINNFEQTFSTNTELVKKTDQRRRGISQNAQKQDQFIDPYSIINKNKKYIVNESINTRVPPLLDTSLPQIVNQTFWNRVAPKRVSIKTTGSIRRGQQSPTKTLLPKEFRNDPFAKPYVIKQGMIEQDGILSLINRGLVSKEIDIGPAFTQINAPLTQKPLQIYDFNMKKIQQENNRDKEIQVGFNLSLHRSEISNQSKKKAQSVTPKVQATRMSQSNEVEKNSFITQDKLIEIFQAGQFKIRDYQLQNVQNVEWMYSFKQTHLPYWGAIEHVIKVSIDLLRINCLSYVCLDAIAVSKLARESQLRRPLFLEILNLIIEAQVREQIVTNAKRNHVNKVIRIQSFVRGVQVRIKYRFEKNFRAKISIIQMVWRRIMLMKKMKAQCVAARKDRETDWENQQFMFKGQWNNIQKFSRTEIHVLSFTPEEMMEIQINGCHQMLNTQIGRIFRVENPSLDVILITSLSLVQEVQDYYLKIIELGSMKTNRGNVTFMSPPIQDNELPLSRVILYGHLYEKLKKRIKDTRCYIVPASEYKYTQLLAQWLQIPLLGCPQVNYRSILNKIQIPLPPGSSEISNYNTLIHTLTILISHNPEIQVWVFKIKAESNGLGVAQLNIRDIPSILGITQRQTNDDNIILNIQQALEESIMKQIKYKKSINHRDIQSYLEFFYKYGGYLEAQAPFREEEQRCPSISLLLSPSGEIENQIIWDRVEIYPNRTYASFYQHYEIGEFEGLTSIISQEMYLQGYFGFLTIDIITFPNPHNKYETLFWVLDLTCSLNNYSAGHFYFQFLVDHSQADLTNYLFIPLIYHTNLLNMKTRQFFELCRSDGISFDLEQKLGATYLMHDQICLGAIGLMIISKNLQTCLNECQNALNFILKLNIDSSNVPQQKKKLNKEVRDFYLQITEGKVKRLLN